MEMNTGAILTAMVLGVMLTGAASWVVSGLYRRRMLALMRRSPPPDPAQPVAATRAPAPARPAVMLDAGANQRASWRYLFAVSALSLLIGVTQSVLALLFIYGSELLSVGRALTLGAVYAWPMALTWGLVRRWSWLRTLGAIGLYLLAMLALTWWRSVSPQPLTTSLGWLGGLVLIPVLVTLVIGASGRIRAVAPYLLPIFMLLAASSVLALQLLVSGVDDPPRWLITLVGTVGAWPAIVLMALAPWLLLAWPAWAIARALARAYRGKRFSDLWYLLAAYWLVVLGASALPSLQGVGLIALTQFIPWLWIPLVAWGLRGWLAPRGVPPTLLVLRVFQQDAGVQALFDRVVERWRHSGNTVLIAGTDLLSRTIDPDDVFTFLNGRLAERFVANEAQVAERLRDFDLDPDPDGRYRVNECYCFDSTWQQALAALVAQADVVLMDLRGFQARNQGCRHELGVLATAPHLQRVVLLFDGNTDRHTALADLVGAPEGRVVWVEAGRLEQKRVAQIVGALLRDQR
ncbi:hypothetical protein ASE11_00090 [Hydrogenophaga sp. Root209]|uniref:hypothetical protein n=1 Tax=Hydrogenophaga sp. Root209 TaxID=1736490 RepID=UPI0006FEB3F1|nr:hypothetical protein [Hydrogenophaga sp. Root209]KRC11928.1 hypothetical protein ASE11_00090 [Hydrogenophaga sp. Root209]